MLGTPALFATAYGNVGSSIYYALGLTAVYALGLTPVVFLIAGIVFAMTAATYAEGTVLYPEAGGSSSFARHGFNEIVSFGAAWGAGPGSRTAFFSSPGAPATKPGSASKP